jgi:mono/diheme cytochrome c family protein
MKRLRKWLARGAVVLLALVVLAAATVFVLSQARLTRVYAVPVENVGIPTESAAFARGHHLAIISGCVDCHGPDLAGRVFFENAMIGRFVAPNLTGGKGGAGGHFTDQDWVRAIRHGVGPDGTPLLVMPSKEFYALGDADLGALIAYLKTIPAVDNTLPASTVSPMGRVLMLVMKDLPLLAAERIDHNAARPPEPMAGVTVEYGKYLAVRCTGCHGETLTGGKIPGTPPDWPPALNLTPYPGSAIAQWSQAQFIDTLRTGVTPGGRQLDNRYMPWKVLGQMTDDEMKALWLYLRSLPPREYGSR